MANQLQGTYEYIDIPYVLAGIKMQLGLRESTSEDIYLMDSINQILKELRNFGTLSYLVTQLEIDHEGATPKAQLPIGFIRFTKRGSIVFTDAEGNAVPAIISDVQTSVVVDGAGGDLGTMVYSFPYTSIPYSQPVFLNNAFFENSPYQSGTLGGVSMNIVDGWIYFSSNLTADFVKIAYLGSNMEDGKIKIPTYAELALRYGVCEMFSATQFAITGEQKYRVMQQDYQVKYARHKAKAKVIAVMPDAKEYEFINYTFNTLV
jgi:hypothetical protein